MLLLLGLLCAYAVVIVHATVVPFCVNVFSVERNRKKKKCVFFHCAHIVLQRFLCCTKLESDLQQRKRESDRHLSDFQSSIFDATEMTENLFNERQKPYKTANIYNLHGTMAEVCAAHRASNKESSGNKKPQEIIIIKMKIAETQSKSTRAQKNQLIFHIETIYMREKQQKRFQLKANTQENSEKMSQWME